MSAGERPWWWAQAACRGVGVDVFFLGRGSQVAVMRALDYCERCPVRPECLADALEQEGGYHFGVRGGMRAEERRRVHR